MKKFVSLIICSALLLGAVSGCGSKDSSDDKSSSVSETTEASTESPAESSTGEEETTEAATSADTTEPITSGTSEAGSTESTTAAATSAPDNSGNTHTGSSGNSGADNNDSDGLKSDLEKIKAATEECFKNYGDKDFNTHIQETMDPDLYNRISSLVVDRSNGHTLFTTITDRTVRTISPEDAEEIYYLGGSFRNEGLGAVIDTPSYCSDLEADYLTYVDGSEPCIYSIASDMNGDQLLNEMQDILYLSDNMSDNVLYAIYGDESKCFLCKVNYNEPFLFIPLAVMYSDRNDE
ncbi:MAG: hypothetical protein IJK31_03835 [Ruminococcus sp.]|nr:hypothetical protein [Ruminococcus sp.]